MAPRVKLALALGGLYLLLAVLFSALGVVLWADMQDGERQAIRAALEVRAGLAIFVILLSWALLGLVVQALYRAYVQGPLSLREQALVIATSNPALRLPETGAPEIRALAQAVNSLAEQREALERDVEDRIRQARA